MNRIPLNGATWTELRGGWLLPLHSRTCRWSLLVEHSEHIEALRGKS